MGYIYILSNKYYRNGNLLKIGMTSRTVDKRVGELNRAFGVPEDFYVVFKKQARVPSVAEKEIHRRLSRYRINKSREFFLVDSSVAIDAVTDVCKTLNRKTNTENSSVTRNVLIIILVLSLYLI